jgi:hypothetical protein
VVLKAGDNLALDICVVVRSSVRMVMFGKLEETWKRMFKNFPGGTEEN